MKLTCSIEVTKGVSPKILLFYAPGKNFTCLDGSLTVPFSYINDDYCDCPDGTDEPGTSACLNGNYYCRNKGYVPQEIPSSFVDDGICDCCDASDESDSTKCPNTCEKLAKEARYAKERAHELLNEIKYIREEIIARGKVMLQRQLDRKTELEKERLEVELMLEEFELKSTPKNGRSMVTSNIKTQGKGTTTPKKENTISRVFGAEKDKTKDEFHWIKNFSNIEEHNDFREALKDEIPITEIISEYKSYLIHNNISSGQVSSDASRSSGINKKASEVENNEERSELPNRVESPNYLSIASSTKIINRELTEINNFLSIDFGLENEFAILYGQCYTFSDPQYVYKLCPFEVVTQTDKTSRNEITLGVWATWTGDNYNIMLYDDGQICGNGLKRSTEVIIDCGLINQINNVKEPERCVYAIYFQSPAICRLEEDTLLHDEL